MHSYSARQTWFILGVGSGTSPNTSQGCVEWTTFSQCRSWGCRQKTQYNRLSIFKMSCDFLSLFSPCLSLGVSPAWTPHPCPRSCLGWSPDLPWSPFFWVFKACLQRYHPNIIPSGPLRRGGGIPGSATPGFTLMLTNKLITVTKMLITHSFCNWILWYKNNCWLTQPFYFHSCHDILLPFNAAVLQIPAYNFRVTSHWSAHLLIIYLSNAPFHHIWFSIGIF